MFNGIGIRYSGICDVNANFRTYFKQLTNKSIKLFNWKNLPDTIDETWLMEQLILSGRVCFTKFNDKLYALNGSIGGEPNCYYEPQNFIVANPVLGSKQIKIRHKDGSNNVEGLEGILVSLTKADQNLEGTYGGLYGIIYKYAGLLADNDVSLNCAQINGRLNVGFTADSEQEARTGELVLKDWYNGKPYRILTQNIIEKINPTILAQSGTNTLITSLIEAHRSLLQDFYNEIGVGYQGNAKRERVNTAEVGLMRGCLDLSLDIMISSLKEGVERVNELFGTSIEVEINENVFYEGSGNATLGEEIEENSAAAAVDEKNDTKIIEEAEERGKEGLE